MTKWRWGTNMTTKADVLQDVLGSVFYIGLTSEMGLA